MTDISFAFDWLAFLSIGLMSITVPTYTLSLGFLGRERRRTAALIENRQRDLKKKLGQISQTKTSQLGVESLKQEIKAYESDIRRYRSRLGALSITSAFVLPFFFFGVALVMAGYANYFWPADQVLSRNYGFVSAYALFVGLVFLGRTLYAVQAATRRPETLAAFRVSFSSGLTAERFVIGEQRDVEIVLYNYGKEMAEHVLMMAFFPTTFQVLGTAGGSLVKQTTLADHAGYVAASRTIEAIHEDILTPISVTLKMPNVSGTYEVPVKIWEGRLGKSEHKLTFEVA